MWTVLVQHSATGAVTWYCVTAAPRNSTANPQHQQLTVLLRRESGVVSSLHAIVSRYSTA